MRMRLEEHNAEHFLSCPLSGLSTRITDAGRRLNARLIVSTGPPLRAERQKFIRNSPWPWGARQDIFTLSTPSQSDPGDNDWNAWLAAARALGQWADEATRGSALADLGIESASAWYPLAPASKFVDYWHLVVHMLSWKRVIGAETSIWWRIESIEPPSVTAVSELPGSLSHASEEAATLVDSLYGARPERSDASQLVLANPLTPLATPREVLDAARRGRLGPVSRLPYRAAEDFVGTPLIEHTDPFRVRREDGDAPPDPVVIEGFAVKQGGKVADLGNTIPLKVFTKLHAERGRHVAHPEIERAVWGDIGSRSKTLHQHVSTLKRKLSEAGFDNIEIDGSQPGYYKLTVQ